MSPHSGFLLSGEQVIPPLSVSQSQRRRKLKSPAIMAGLFVRNTVLTANNRTGPLTCCSGLLDVLDSTSAMIHASHFLEKIAS